MQRRQIQVQMMLVLLVAMLCSMTACAKREFKASNKEVGLEMKGYFEKNQFHIEFQVKLAFAEKSLLFFWRKNSPADADLPSGLRGHLPDLNNCPSFVTVFTRVRAGQPTAYVAGACTEDNGEDPDMMEELSVDFDRTEDTLKDGILRFKGSVEYKVDLEKFSMSKLNELYVRGVGHDNKLRFESRFPF